VHSRGGDRWKRPKFPRMVARVVTGGRDLPEKRRVQRYSERAMSSAAAETSAMVALAC
jgi:hypothetical protein